MDRDAKWAERDRRREAVEAELERRMDASRERYVKLVEAALRAGDPGGFLSPHGHAAIAVDALLADGVVFAHMGTWDDGGDDRG